MKKKYGWGWRFLGPCMMFVPKNLVSFFVGILVRLELPVFLREPSVRLFMNVFNINIEEAEKPFEEYRSISQLFSRRLKPGARPIGEGVVHPVDGTLTRQGRLGSDYLIQTKGITYGLESFLGDAELAESLKGGSSLTYYLCPTDYHRVHAPVNGEVEQVNYIPGQLWPVNAWSVENISQLFCRNERLVLKLGLPDREDHAVLVMVGATNVGSMTLSFDPQVKTNAGHIRMPHKKNYRPKVPVEKGDELGAFNMGSSVVVVYPPGYLDIPNQEPNTPVKMGTPLKKGP